MISVLRTALVLKPMSARNFLLTARDAAKEMMSPARMSKPPPGMVTFPSRSTAQIRMSWEISRPSSASVMPQRRLPSGILILIISACPWAKESTSSAVGISRIRAASVADSSSGLMIMARPSFSRR